MFEYAPVRFVIVGCGSIAQKGYQPRLQAYPKKVALHGYCDQHRPSAEGLAAQAGGGKVYDSVEDVLADPEVEAILNLTTIKGHYPLSLAALKAGKHVYSEKPISITSAQATELIEEAEKRGLKLACAPSSPLGYEQQDVWRRIRAGEIGQPHTVIGNFSCTRLEAWHPNADAFMADGISVVGDAAPYPLIMMTTYFGPVARVFGFARNVVPERKLMVGPRAGTPFKPAIPDHVMGLLEFANGMRGFLNCGWSGRSDTPPFEVSGTEGGFALNPHNDGAGIRTWSQYSGEIKPVPTPAKAMPNALDWGKGPVDLADAIRRKRPVRCSPYQARHLVEIAERLNEASLKGGLVELTTRFDPPEPVGEVAPWE
ncbi:MAG: oxidoreductase [Planctomycetota bacterium]